MALTVIPVEAACGRHGQRGRGGCAGYRQKVELENMVNTMSTGLFNERYFSRVLNICEAKKRRSCCTLIRPL